MLSRQELAEAVNALVFATYGARTDLDANYIGHLERGEIRWPRERVRAGLRAVLGAQGDAEIGLFIVYGAGRAAAETEPPTPPVQPQIPPTVAQPAGLVSRLEIDETRLALGRLLAVSRATCGMTQTALARLVPWSRSTIANVELGRQNAPRHFWERCEKTLNARGVLLVAAEHVDTLIARHRAQVQAQNTAQRLERWAPPPGDPDVVPSPVAPALDLRGEPPTLHLTVSPGASLTISFGQSGRVAAHPVRVVVSAADEPYETDRPSGADAQVYSMAEWRRG